MAKLVALLTVLLGVHSGKKSAITRISIELCSASSRLSLRSTLAGFGLDDACAQLESSTYVMADEARPHFCVDRLRQQSYGEDLVDAIGHLSAVSPDAER